MSEVERSRAPRNGLPEFKPYVYRGVGGDADPRIRRYRRSGTPVPLVVRCPACGYLSTSLGHRTECGNRP